MWTDLVCKRDRVPVGEKGEEGGEEEAPGNGNVSWSMCVRREEYGRDHLNNNHVWRDL